MKLQYGLLGILALVPFVSPLPASAYAAPQAVISEVNWAGSQASTADEWFELTNLSNTPIDLTGWTVVGAAGTAGTLSLPAGSTIPAYGTFLISNYNLGDLKTTLTVKPDMVTTAVSLANSGLNMALTAPDGTIVDSFVTGSKPAYGSTAPYSSAERDLTTLDWHTAITEVNFSVSGQFGTPGTAVFPPPPPAPAPIITEPDLAPVPATDQAAATEPEPIPVAAPDAQLETSPLPPPSEGGGVSEPIPLALEPVLTAEPTAEIAPTQVVTADPAETTTVDASIVTADTEAVIAPAPEPVVVESIIEPMLSTSPLPSPSEEDVASEPMTYPMDSVVINEFVSDPADGTEWIEVLNTTDSAVDLTGWTEKDATSTKTVFPPETLGAHAYFVLQNPKSKLNNDGDSIFLFDATGKTINAISYDKTSAPKKGKSLARKDDGTWKESTPTPLSLNQWVDVTADPNTATYATTNDTSTSVSNPEPNSGQDQGTDNVTGTPSPVRVEREPEVEESLTPSQPPSLKEGGAILAAQTDEVPVIDASEITNYAANATVTVEGVLVAAPGTFGKQLAYLDGLEIYFNKADWPKLSAMTRIRVTGTVDKKADYTRLKIRRRADITVIGDDAIAPDALESLDDAEHGLLMSLTGSVTDVTGKKLTVTLENGETINATPAKDAAVDFSKLAYGDRIAATGIVRRVKDSWTFTILNQTGLTILQADTTAQSATAAPIASSQPLPSKGGEATPQTGMLPQTIKAPAKQVPWVGGGLLTTSIGALGYWFAKAKGLTLPFITQT